MYMVCSEFGLKTTEFSFKGILTRQDRTLSEVGEMALRLTKIGCGTFRVTVKMTELV